MFKEYLNKLKSKLLDSTENSNKRKIENLIVFLVILIITVIAINIIWGDTKKSYRKEESINNSYKQLADNLDEYNDYSSNIQEFNEYNLEQSLEDILSKISGVGKVDVLITYSETSQIVAMFNETYNSTSTEETDVNGGTRKIEQMDTNKEIVFEDNENNKNPITQKIIMPKIEGAVITAEGASNINIKTNIIQAVSAATGLPVYKVQVFEMSS